MRPYYAWRRETDHREVCHLCAIDFLPGSDSAHLYKVRRIISTHEGEWDGIWAAVPLQDAVVFGERQICARCLRTIDAYHVVCLEEFPDIRTALMKDAVPCACRTCAPQHYDQQGLYYALYRRA